MYLKSAAFPEMDRLVSSRAFWREHGSQASGACVERLKRDWVYGLNYYAGGPFKDCIVGAAPSIVEESGVLKLR
jgi:hypothetical protein